MLSVKRTASRGETGMVGVQGCAEAEASSHQTRKRCRKRKVVEGSSDQPQEGGQEVEIIEGSSDQPKEGGSMTKKQERDYKRYHSMKDGAQKYKEMGPQMEILKNDTAELRVEVGKISSERLPAITEHLAMVAEQLKIVMNDYQKMGTLTEGFVQSELKKNDREIRLDNNYPDGKANWSSEGIPNVENLLTDSEYPLDVFDLVGMSREEILPELQKIKDSFEEFKRESDRRYEEFKRESDRCYEELKRESDRRYEELRRESDRRYEELKRENKRLNSRITTIETLKNK